MLTQLKLNNFKIWRSTGPMAIAPLTLLFGMNSSGKSSLIQSLLLLRQTVKGQDPNLDLNLGTADARDSVTLGQFADVLCKHGAATEAVKARQIGIEFGWRGGEDGESKGVFSARYHAGPGGSADLAYLRIGRGPDGFAVQRGKHGAYKLWAADVRRAMGQSATFKPERSFTFSAAAVEALGAKAATVLSAGPALVAELSSIIYLGPVRRLAQRDYVWNGRFPGSIGDDGGQAVDVLIASGVAKAKAQRRRLPVPAAARVFDETARWLRNMGLADELQVRQLGDSARYELLVVSNGSASNLKDVGVGVSQVMPVVVAALFAEAGHIVIVEEPESHLHPLAQAQLAEMLVAVSSERQVQFIVETHSEHLLRRMQTLIAKGRTAAGQLKMYFVERTQSGADLKTLEVDEFGTIRNWPDHFFGDSAGEAREQARARAERMRSAGRG